MPVQQVLQLSFVRGGPNEMVIDRSVHTLWVKICRKTPKKMPMPVEFVTFRVSDPLAAQMPHASFLPTLADEVTVHVGIPATQQCVCVAPARIDTTAVKPGGPVGVQRDEVGRSLSERLCLISGCLRNLDACCIVQSVISPWLAKRRPKSTKTVMVPPACLQ